MTRQLFLLALTLAVTGATLLGTLRAHTSRASAPAAVAYDDI